MKKQLQRLLLLMCCVTQLAIAGDSPNRTEIRRVDFDGAPGMEMICSIVEFKPGDTSTKHFHHGVEAAYVLQGATIQEPGKEPRVLATGTNIINLRDVFHGGFTVVGDQNLKIYTVHVVDKNKSLYDTAQ